MATRKHNFTRTEISAGLLVALAATALVGFAAVVLGLRPPRPMHAYHASFSKIIGLNPGADVRFGGVKAGYVSSIEPEPDKQSLIRVTVMVDAHIPVNEESVATIEQVTLTAEKHLEISTGSDVAPRLGENGVIASRTLGGGFVELPDMEGIIARTEKLLDDVTAFLGVDLAVEREEAGEQPFARLSDLAASAQGALDEGAELLEDARGVLAGERDQISAILKKVGDIEDAALAVASEVGDFVRENRPMLEQGLSDAGELASAARGAVAKAADRLDALIDALQQALDHAAGLGETARDMLDQNRNEIEQTLADARQTVRYLRSFARTMSEEPHAVIRGKRPVGR